MKILVTGGEGFIGRNLKEQLAEEFEVHAPRVAELDLLNEKYVKDYLKGKSFDVVFHTATWNATRNSKKDLAKTLDHNLRMFFNLAKQGNHFGKMINLGSGAEYDKRIPLSKVKEDFFDARVPADDYGFSKYIIAKYIERADNIYNARLFAVFGKYEDWEIRFISNACCKAVYDLPITIKQNCFFDYVHIDDLVRIFKWFIKNTQREKAYNICGNQPRDLKSLAQKVLKVSGKDLKILIAEDGLKNEYSGDNARLLNEMGSFDFTDIEESIEALYRWYEKNKDKIDRRLLTHDK